MKEEQTPQEPRGQVEYRCSDWLTNVLRRDRQKTTIARAVRTIKASGLKFDAIAFRGASGALIGPILAYMLGKTMIMVRKERREGHSYYLVEGEYTARTYLIVDDFISRGTTVRAIVEGVNNFTQDNCGRQAKCVGAYLSYYNEILEWKNLQLRAGLSEPVTSPLPFEDAVKGAVVEGTVW
jgi:hypoxanthine phosphoribosyltransferase